MRAQRRYVILVCRPPDLPQKRGVGHQSAATSHQRREQAELGPGQMDVFAPEGDDVGREVKLELPGSQDRTLVARRGAPQAGLKPRDELPGTKRLRHVVVRS